MGQHEEWCVMRLTEGDVVTLENQDGIRSDPIHVRVTERIRDDCAYMVHGFGAVAPKIKKAYRRGTGRSPATPTTCSSPGASRSS